MVIFMTTKEKRHVSFDKNDSVTPDVLMDKYRVLPLMFFFMTTDKKQCHPLCFFS